MCVLNTYGGVRVWWDEEQFACGPTVPYNAVTDTAESIIRKVLRRRALPKGLRKIVGG